MNEEDTDQEKQSFASNLQSLPDDQFAKVAETVDAERKKRDNGSSEAEFNRKVSTMPNGEFEQWKRENGWA